MVEIESPLFLKLVRERSLQHPTSRRFDGRAWIEAANALPNQLTRDQQILSAALHYGSEIAKLRSTFENNIFDGLNRRDALLLSVAMANYNYSILSDKAHKQAKSGRGKVFHFGVAGHQTIKSGFPGNASTPDTAIATIVDTLPHCLERANRLPEAVPDNSVNYWKYGSRIFAIMSVEHSLRDLWQRVLWDGWKIEIKDQELRQCPEDRDLATLWEVWMWRHEMILSQGTNLDAMKEKFSQGEGKVIDAFITPTVVGIGGRSRETRTFRFGQISGRETGQVWHRSENAILEDSYLAQFLDASLPSFDNKFSCRDLQKAWCVLRDCAQVLMTRSKIRRFENFDSVESLALLIRREEIERALVSCAGVNAEQANKMVDLFSCDLSKSTNLFTKGFWAAPLLSIDGGKNISIVFASLSIGSGLRRVETWLERGGLSDHLADARRGTKYEAWARSEIVRGIIENELLPNAKCAPDAIFRSDNKGEQIDLLVVLGNLLIVGEVKCFLYPIESSEHYDYLRKLNEAGDQAVRKAEWLMNNQAEIVKALQISPERAAGLRPVPIVVTNQGAGFSLDANGARVVDFHFLRLYLSESQYVAGMAFHAAKREAVQQFESLYSNEVEAAEGFETAMATPVPLKRYLKSAVWKDNHFPISNGKTMAIENCYLGDAFTKDAEKITSMLT